MLLPTLNSCKKNYKCNLQTRKTIFTKASIFQTNKNYAAKTLLSWATNASHFLYFSLAICFSMSNSPYYRQLFPSEIHGYENVLYKTTGELEYAKKQRINLAMKTAQNNKDFNKILYKKLKKKSIDRANKI